LNGVIISRNVEPGQTVTAQDSVLVMSDRLIVKAQVDETDIARIRPKQAARVVLDAYPEEGLPGSVDHIAFEAKTVNNVTIYEVDVVPKQVPDFMRSGMTANVNFLVAEKQDVLVLPAEAVREEEGRAQVMIPAPSGQGRPVSQPVQTGLTDGKNVEIVSGLEEGDAVLVRVTRLPRASGPGQRNPFAPAGGRSGSRSRRGS
jgi:macrolide-specific efflux system membrane fusion protein